MKDKKETMAWKLLKWIGNQKDGVTLTDIQFFIWTKLNYHLYADFYRKDHNGQRYTRGHWNTQLYGGDYYHDGLLNLYCKKVDGRWVLKNMPHPTKPNYRTLKEVENDVKEVDENSLTNKIREFVVIQDFPGAPPLGVTLDPKKYHDLYEMAPFYPNYFREELLKSYNVEIIKGYKICTTVKAKNFKEAHEIVVKKLNNNEYSFSKIDNKITIST